MTVYALATLNIHDRDRYAEYEAGFMEVFAQYAGKLLAVDEAVDALEGEWPFTRTVIIEFPSKSDLLAWYESDAYQAILAHRQAASTGNVVILDGLTETT